MIDAPVTLPLRNEAVIGVLGGMRAVLFTQGLLMQIAALHSYHDVHIAVLTEEGSASQWQWTRWLPHVFTSEDRELRMVAYTPDDIPRRRRPPGRSAFHPQEQPPPRTPAPTTRKTTRTPRRCRIT